MNGAARDVALVNGVPRDVAVVNGLARWLDGAMIDPLVGLLAPGVGDFVSSAAGLVVVAFALRRRMPAVVVARMLLNLAVDAGVGAIPLAGDIFDVFHKAHQKNAELFAAHAEGGMRRSTWRDWLIVAGAGVAFVAAIALPLYVAWRIVEKLF